MTKERVSNQGEQEPSSVWVRMKPPGLIVPPQQHEGPVYWYPPYIPNGQDLELDVLSIAKRLGKFPYNKLHIYSLHNTQKRSDDDVSISSISDSGEASATSVLTKKKNRYKSRIHIDEYNNVWIGIHFAEIDRITDDKIMENSTLDRKELYARLIDQQLREALNKTGVLLHKHFHKGEQMTTSAFQGALVAHLLFLSIGLIEIHSIPEFFISVEYLFIYSQAAGYLIGKNNRLDGLFDQFAETCEDHYRNGRVLTLLNPLRDETAKLREICDRIPPVVRAYKG